jgi:hypothetical protein
LEDAPTTLAQFLHSTEQQESATKMAMLKRELTGKVRTLLMGCCWMFLAPSMAFRSSRSHWAFSSAVLTLMLYTFEGPMMSKKY